jgi:hypothetical protein
MIVAAFWAATVFNNELPSFHIYIKQKKFQRIYMLAEKNSMYNDYYLKRALSTARGPKAISTVGPRVWGPLIPSFNAIAHRGSSLKPPLTKETTNPWNDF